jgi:hypothetical protein
MPSAIDPTKPTEKMAYTVDIRSNFEIAAAEISTLQAQVARLTAAMMASGMLTAEPAEAPGETIFDILHGR